MSLLDRFCSRFLTTRSTSDVYKNDLQASKNWDCRSAQHCTWSVYSLVFRRSKNLSPIEAHCPLPVASKPERPSSVIASSRNAPQLLHDGESQSTYHTYGPPPAFHEGLSLWSDLNNGGIIAHTRSGRRQLHIWVTLLWLRTHLFTLVSSGECLSLGVWGGGNC